jgi:hypothetical protein
MTTTAAMMMGVGLFLLVFMTMAFLASRVFRFVDFVLAVMGCAPQCIGC